MSLGRRASGVDDEVARASPTPARRPARAPFSPARSTSAPAEYGIPSGTISTDGSRVLEDAAGARRLERLGPLAERQRVTGDGSQRGRIAGRDPEIRRQHDLARAVQPAVVIGELHVGRGNVERDPAVARRA